MATYLWLSNYAAFGKKCGEGSRRCTSTTGGQGRRGPVVQFGKRPGHLGDRVRRTSGGQPIAMTVNGVEQGRREAGGKKQLRRDQWPSVAQAQATLANFG
jgi:hypothetical protein